MLGLHAFWLENTLFGRPVAAFIPFDAGETLPFHRFTCAVALRVRCHTHCLCSVGTQVLVSTGDPLKEEPIRGTVVSIPSTGTRIDVCFQTVISGLADTRWR